jgi:selenocysteine lyase/cysteine desulfurase
MTNAFLKGIKQHIWIGISKFLIIFYLSVFIILYVDYLKCKVLGINLKDVIEISSVSGLLNFNFISIIGLFFLLPILITVLKYFFREIIKNKFIETSKTAKIFIFCFHIVAFSLIFFFYYLTPYIQQLSGYEINHNVATFSYNSVLYNFINNVAIPINIISIAWFIIYTIIHLNLHNINVKNLILEYNVWLELAYPEGEIYPLCKGLFNFNAGAISPEIKYISNTFFSINKKYQEYTPGSQMALRYLKKIAKECREDLKKLLKITDNNLNYKIQFCSGTSRAIELSILKIPTPLTIVTSPFEHPSEINVVKWIASQKNNVILERCEIELSLLDHDWDKLLLYFYSKLDEIIKNSESNYIILISEICFLNGMKIPILEIMGYIRNKYINNKIFFLIDASHSVGNIKDSFGNGGLILHDYDSYIFGAHKWLLSPEPFGIIISELKIENKIINRIDENIYDLWDNNIPITTTGIAKIGYFKSCLRFFLEKRRIESLLEKSKIIKENFLKNADIVKNFDVIGDTIPNELSSMISIKPKNNKKWKFNKLEDLNNYFIKSNINCMIFDVGDNCFWLRITFLYFITQKEINKLISILKKSIYSE